MTIVLFSWFILAIWIVISGLFATLPAMLVFDLCLYTDHIFSWLFWIICHADCSTGLWTFACVFWLYLLQMTLDYMIYVLFNKTPQMDSTSDATEGSLQNTSLTMNLVEISQLHAIITHHREALAAYQEQLTKPRPQTHTCFRPFSSSPLTTLN